jgi:hypothetical protein
MQPTINMDKTLSTNAVSDKAGIKLSARLLLQLGLIPAFQTKIAIMWYEKDVPKILATVGKYFINKSIQEMK